jgi:hypothetical protein
MLLAAAGLLCAVPPVSAERDSGASHNLLLKAPLGGDWFLISRSNLASRNDFDDNFLGFTGAGLGYQLNDAWSLRAGYRHVWFRPQAQWLEEDRLYLEAFYADRIGDARFSSRSRVEFRYFDYREDDVRLRNEFTLEPALTLGHASLHPYLEEEFFFGTREGRFEANWLGAGIAWRPAKGVKLKLGYRWNRFRVGDDWRDRDVLVTGVNLFF